MALTLAGTPAINGLSLPTDSFSPGMVLVNKTDFSAVASVSLNNVFSATYDHYKIVIEMSDTTGGATMNMRLRSGGTDSTSSIYSSQQARFQSTGSSMSATYDSFFAVGYAQYAAMELNIFSPFASKYTRYSGTNPLTTTIATASFQYWVVGGFYYATTSYDGLTLYPNTGTFSGTVRVYGLRNA